MNTRALKDILLNNCPHIPALRKFLAKQKVAALRSHLIPEEEVIQGESNIEEKRRIVEKYMAKWPKYTQKEAARAERMLKDAPGNQGRNDLDFIRTDMWFCYYAYGFSTEEYFYFGLEGTSMEQRRSFVSNLERIIAAFRMNDFSDMQLLNNKWKTYQKLRKYFGRDAILVSKPGHYAAFQAFVAKHPVFIKKRLDLSKGESVELIDSANCGLTTEELFKSLLPQGKLILEELIVQNEKMAVFNSSSVNTVRFFSYNTRHGIKSPFGFLRTGRPGAVVDNAGAGGVFAALDMERGVVIAQGCDEMGGLYDKHPNSGVPYIGFEIPEWDKAVALCYEAASLFKTVKSIGWDIAYTDKGWIIVEANMSGQLVHQGSLRHGIKTDLEAVMQDMDLMA